MSLRMSKDKAEGWLSYYKTLDERKKVMKETDKFFESIGFKKINSKEEKGTLICVYENIDFKVTFSWKRESEYVSLSDGKGVVR